MAKVVEMEAKQIIAVSPVNIKKNIQIYIIDGKGHWSKEIGLKKTIDGNLKIRYPAEGSWNIKFEEGNDPNLSNNTFQEDDRVKTVHIVSFNRHQMEKKFLVLNFKWNEDRNAILKAHLHLNVH